MEASPSMICGRCDEPIRPGQQYSMHDIPGASLGGATVHRHLALCKRMPIQTVQNSRPR
ncbi:hypothetical protein ACGFWD_39300 [Streptomyces sp. NPDC048448]|uniref:hypothetical protein n=1 Tax=unclassified Streptomyces TaxID=2593676 RepID=UPI002E355470|nr:hypothetical protein [Streptomyces sp. NBC_01455]